MDNELIFPPQMNKIFEVLSRGYHICIDDGEMYSDLMENEKFIVSSYGEDYKYNSIEEAMNKVKNSKYASCPNQPMLIYKLK